MASMLSIIIPAYNEEESISSTLEQTLNAIPEILRIGQLDKIEIIVVNDGSGDSTAEEVNSFLDRRNEANPQIRLVQHEINQGYGAAIKTGFAAAQGDLLGFMDADGTCEPATFGSLCQARQEHQADVVLGSRMILSGSGMPFTRKIGNRIFAGFLSLISTSRVTDSASGMRVLRRSSLPLLLPLPDGLHFTPAMSARAVLDPHLKIIEVPMKYHERIGQSKLGMIQDGLRFLSVIMEIALTYRPLRFFGAIGILLLLLALAYSIFPILHYIRERQVFDWMIYRLLAVTVFFVAGLNLLTIGLLANAVVRSFQRLQRSTLQGSIIPPVSRSIRQQKWLGALPVFGILLGLIGIGINRTVLWEYFTTGHITAHWTYPVTGAFFVLTGLQLFSFGVIHRIFVALEDKQTFLFTTSDNKNTLSKK